MQLLNSTTSPAADEAIRFALRTVQELFPRALLSAYVTGSYANAYAVPTSDVDLFLVFDGTLSKKDEKLAQQIHSKLEHITPSLDLVFRGLSNLLEVGVVGMPDSFLHVFGEPLHQKIRPPAIEDYAYSAMHGGYLRMQLTRKSKPYRVPLKFPKERSSLKGYDWREKIHFQGKTFDSIKEIVVLTGWMATGLTAWKGRVFVPTKNQAVELFKSKIGGPFAADFETITQLCRNQCAYKVPENPKDFKDLQSLLPKVLAFENFFMENYQDFLIENLNSPNPIRVHTSLLRLGEIVYPNARSIQALQDLKLKDAKLEELSQKALKRLKSFAQRGKQLKT